MITNLKIKNFILIEDLDVDFKSNFNILMGETGAGKSIIVNALSLLTGRRSQFDSLLDENKKALIEASFTLSNEFIKNHPLLKDYIEQNELIVSRSMLPSKTTTIRVNGEIISLAELSAIMEDVVEISSQGSQSFLAQRQNQLKILDRFIDDPKFKKAKEDFSRSYNTYLRLQVEKEEFVQSAKSADLDSLRYRLDEIKKREVEEGEIEELLKDRQIIKSMSEYIETSSLLNEFYNSDTYEEFARGIVDTLRHIKADELQEAKDDVLNRWEEFAYEFMDLVSKASSFDIDESRVEHVESRLFELEPLMKRYGSSSQEIISALQKLETAIGDLEHFEEELLAFEKRIVEAKELSTKLACELSFFRGKMSEKLNVLVNSEFEELGLRPDGFKIELSICPLSSSGIDEVNFLVGLNKGRGYCSINEAASGGETSRLAIALKESFNSLYPADTLIFDEVDSGVSGAIALKVGKKIKKISNSSSIIAISHLPQVVAAADGFFYVSKSDQDERTLTFIKPLEKDEAIKEIAIMLSGTKGLEAGETLARQLIQEQNN